MLFFDDSVSEDTVARYMHGFSRDGMNTIDLIDLATKLPSQGEPVRDYGFSPPPLIVGAERDSIVDITGVTEMSEFSGVKPLFLPSAAHDLFEGGQVGSLIDVMSSFLKEIE